MNPTNAECPRSPKFRPSQSAFRSVTILSYRLLQIEGEEWLNEKLRNLERETEVGTNIESWRFRVKIADSSS